MSMDSHSLVASPAAAIQGRAKTKTSAVVIDTWLAGIPLAASLITAAFFTSDLAVIDLLEILLFIISIGLLVLWMRRGLKAGRLAGVALLAGFVGWYTFPGMVSLFRFGGRFGDGLPAPIDNQTVVWSITYLSLFLLCWTLAGHFFSREQSPIRADIRSYSTNLGRIVFLAFAAILIGLIPYAASGLSLSEIVDLIFQSRAVDKPWLFTDNLGNTASALAYVAQSAMAAGACLLWAIAQDRRLGRVRRTLAAIIALVVSVIIYFDQGTRSITALVMMPALLLISIELWRQTWKRVLVWIAIVVVALFFILQFQLFFRSSNTRADTPDLLLSDWTTFGGTSDFFTENLFAVQIVPAYHDFFHESVIEQFLVSPIPRFIWPDKPATQVVWFYTLLRWGVDIYQTGGNAFPGIVGQYYMSWGWIGPIMIGLMLGWATARIDAYLSRLDFQKDLYGATIGIMLAVWLFISYRVLSPGFFYPVIFAAIAVFLSRARRPLQKQGS